MGISKINSLSTLENRPHFSKPKIIQGKTLIFRNVEAEAKDAEFILSLRTDPNKSKYLSKTSPDINQQIEWLKRYEKDPSQVYFIIEDHHKEPIGTVRLYDQKEESFCWGSWLIKDGAPFRSGIESALMVYHFGLSLGFKKAHFDVRKGNTSVLNFHEKFGALRIGESSEDFYYTIENQKIKNSLEKFSKFLPNGITIECSSKFTD